MTRSDTIFWIGFVSVLIGAGLGSVLVACLGLVVMGLTFK